MWVDKEWEGRTRSFIRELVNQKFVLEQKLRDKEADTERFKMERKINRKHKQQLKSKGTMLLSVVFILAGLHTVVFCILRGYTVVFVVVSNKYYS